MAEKKTNKKGIPVVAIILVVVVIVAVVGILVNKAGSKDVAENGQTTNQYAAKAKNADDIKIKDSDSVEVKREKIEGKIELINKEIDKKQAAIDEETKKVSAMYEEYVKIQDANNPGVPATKADKKQAEKNMKEYLKSQENKENK